MFLHGGISEDEEYLNDCFLLSYAPLKWNTCPINSENEGIHLAFHTACLVIPADFANNPKITIFKFPDLGVGRRLSFKVIFLIK